ncbi:MAG: efflux RND transporter periplasmic adaptor subunit [Nitrospiria bacterium]
MTGKPTIRLFATLLTGTVLASVIGCTDGPTRTPEDAAQPQEGTPAADQPKGPHGGRLFLDGDFQVEVTIYERGVPPQFRVYSFENGKPVDPAEVALAITLSRLGGRIDEIGFSKEADYLRGDKVVDEPHSFDVQIMAQRQGKTSRWQYAQIEGRVQMPSEVAAATGIDVEAAGPARMKDVRAFSGEIGLDKNRVAHVVSRLAGVVAEIPKRLGDRVKKGDVIAVLDSRELAESKSEYIESVHRLEFAQAAFVREEELWKKKISAEQDYLVSRHALEEAEIVRQVAEQKLLALGLSADVLTALAVEPGGRVIDRKVRAPFIAHALTRYEIRSPLDGMLIEKHVAVGEAISGDAEMFLVADLSTVWGEFTVHAKDLSAVRIGQPVTVRSQDLGLEARGRVSYIGLLVGEQTRTATAHVDIPNPKGLWRPGLFVTVEVVQEEVEVPVAVRAEALQTFRDWDVVFVRYGDQFEARPVELGRRDGPWVEIRSGLAPGESYAARNSFVLKADLGKSGASHDH